MPEPKDIADQEFYAVIGYNRISTYQLPHRATPHYIVPGTYMTLCKRDVKGHYSDNPNIYKLSRDFFDREFRNQYQMEPVICERCWRAYHKALGEEPPEQVRPSAHRDNEEELPLQEVIEITTGEPIKWFKPARVVRREGQIWVYGEHDLLQTGRDKGRPRMYHRGSRIGVRRYGDKLDGSYAFVDEDREAEANEQRAYIRRLERQLAQAKQELLELYVEEE